MKDFMGNPIDREAMHQAIANIDWNAPELAALDYPT